MGCIKTPLHHKHSRKYENNCNSNSAVENVDSFAPGASVGSGASAGSGAISVRLVTKQKTAAYKGRKEGWGRGGGTACGRHY